MNHSRMAAGFAMLASMLVGCEGMGRSDNFAIGQPVYQAPTLPKDQVATVKGTWGTFVEAIDDVLLPVERTYFPLYSGGLGGNSTTVLPGVRKVKLYITQNDESYRQAFEFEFQPGHVYECCRAVNVYDDIVRIVDRTTGDLRYVR